jgi:hypothetical protein
MNHDKPAVSGDFYQGLWNGILLSLPLWAIIFWMIKTVF